jgi:hypothetical protein
MRTSQQVKQKKETYSAVSDNFSQTSKLHMNVIRNIVFKIYEEVKWGGVLKDLNGSNLKPFCRIYSHLKYDIQILTILRKCVIEHTTNYN